MAEETQEIIDKKPPNPVGTEEGNPEFAGVLNPLASGVLLGEG